MTGCFFVRVSKNNPNFGLEHTDETKAKMSAANKGRPGPVGSGCPP